MVAGIIAACSSSTAPKDRITVSLAGPANVQGFLTTINGATVYRCDIVLTATASGGNSGDVATWQGGYYRFTHFDNTTSTTTFSDAQRWFAGHATQFATGTQVTGNDYFYSVTQRPFQLHLELSYSAPRVAQDSVGYDLACQ
jgi:hypothetical protein